MRRHTWLLSAAIVGMVNMTLLGHPAVATESHLDADTESLEQGGGHWAPWYSVTVGRSTARARSGAASLGIAVTAPSGWGVHLDNYPGFAATAGPKRIGFWGIQGAGSSNVTLRVKWRDATNVELATHTVSLTSLAGTWQQTEADVLAPAGTTTVWVELISSTGQPGDYLFVDDVMVGDRPVAPLPPVTTVPVTTPPVTIAPPIAAPRSIAPAVPPAQVCGSESLRGPAVQPAGSVRVDPGGQDLDTLTRANPAGTTFWLAPGTHTLAAHEFGQVAPKDGNVYVGAPDAVVDGRRINRYAFTGGGTGVVIKHLTIRNFVPPQSEGVVNQGAATGWIIESNTVTNNGGAGVFVGSDNVIRKNCLTGNGQYGFSMYKPPIPGDSAIKNITLDHNEISHNNTDNWEVRWKEIYGPTAVCGCTGAGKFWDVKGAVVTGNWVHHNKGVGLWADTNDIAFRFEGNYINDNEDEGIFYEVSYNALIRNNTFKRNGLVKGQSFATSGNPFPVGAIYLSEAGGDARASSEYATLEISGNVFEDNWSGVVLWENANRFCNSPAHTSAGYCTNVGVASIQACVTPTINVEPYYSDCRWKTKNVSVYDNDFRMDKAKLPGCAAAVSCGKQALMSNWGSYPDWSPYRTTAVQKEITFNQNNRFAQNRYVGDWGYMVYDIGHVVTFDEWRASPYGQDSGSIKQ